MFKNSKPKCDAQNHKTKMQFQNQMQIIAKLQISQIQFYNLTTKH
jgi:hypothetical protein